MAVKLKAEFKGVQVAASTLKDRVQKWAPEYDSVMLLVYHLEELMEDRPKLMVLKEDYDSYVRLWDEGGAHDQHARPCTLSELHEPLCGFSGKLRLIHHRCGTKKVPKKAPQPAWLLPRTSSLTGPAR